MPQLPVASVHPPQGSSPTLPVSSDRHQARMIPNIGGSHLSISTETRSPSDPYAQFRSPGGTTGQGSSFFFPAPAPSHSAPSFIQSENFTRTAMGPGFRPRAGSNASPYESGVYQSIMQPQQGGNSGNIFGFMGEEQGSAQGGGGGKGGLWPIHGQSSNGGAGQGSCEQPIWTLTSDQISRS